MRPADVLAVSSLNNTSGIGHWEPYKAHPDRGKNTSLLGTNSETLHADWPMQGSRQQRVCATTEQYIELSLCLMKNNSSVSPDLRRNYWCLNVAWTYWQNSRKSSLKDVEPCVCGDTVWLSRWSLVLYWCGIGIVGVTRYKKVLLCKGHCGEVLWWSIVEYCEVLRRSIVEYCEVLWSTA